MDRRRQPLPDHRVLVWLDPTEVRVQGLWMGFRRSRGVNYGLARRQRWRFRVPGLRPHEAEATRHRRRTLGRSRRMGVSRGHFWRVPWSWRFFEGWATGMEGRIAQPRLSHYRAWWTTWVAWMVRRCHRPRRRRLRLTTWRSMGYAIHLGRRRVGVRRALRVGARVTPPDVRSQRRVARPRIVGREVGIGWRAVQSVLGASSSRSTR
jgi:hypothetical protein